VLPNPATKVLDWIPLSGKVDVAVSLVKHGSSSNGFVLSFYTYPSYGVRARKKRRLHLDGAVQVSADVGDGVWDVSS
jgi:hypothetical protein